MVLDLVRPSGDVFSGGRRGRGVAFSKFDPHREPSAGNAYGATTPAGARRARILRWVSRVVLAYTALGFGLIVYWLATGR